MRVMCNPGSEGGRGGQPPRSTRPIGLTDPIGLTPSASRTEAARAKAVVTNQRADAIRHALEGRQHSDSAELLAEDRLR